jgi:tetratricopeptide (TPR) repeat protein
MRKLFLYTVLIILFIANGPAYGQTGSSDYQYALIEAVKQKNLGNIPGAIELYRMVVEENDSVAIAHYELGSLYVLVNEPEMAEGSFQKAYILDPTNEWYVNGYIDILVMREKYDEAEELIGEFVDSNENEIEYCFKRANIYFLSGKSRKAIRSLNKIENKYGVSDKVILLKANVFEKEEKFKAARKEIEKLIGYFPESLQFLVVAAELALKDKENDLASKYYTEALKLDSTNIYALTNLTDYYRVKKDHRKSLYYLEKSFYSDYIGYKRKVAILSYYLTDLFFMQNYSSELQGLIDAMIKMHPEQNEMKFYAVDFYIKQRNYKEAFEMLKPFLDEQEKDYELWRQGILLANTLSENEDLLKFANQAYAIFPDSSEILYFKGIAEYENELFNEVIKTFSNDIVRRHNNKDLVSQTKQILAESYHSLKMYKESDSLFRNIIREDPNNFLVLNNFSYYLSIRGESLDEARAMSYRTIIENPENGTFLDTYAWVLFKSGEYKEAEMHINKALQKGGLNNPDINEHAAEIHMKLESYHIARSFYEKAIILGGDKDKLEDKLKKLDEINEK